MAVSCYAFLAVFPLLLLLVTILGIVLRDDPHAQQTVLHSALAEFPIIGTQLRENVHSLNRTGIGLVIGLLGTVWGARGVANTAQVVCTTVWAVPFTARPPWIARQLRSLALLATISVAALATGVDSSIAGVGSGHAPWLEVLGVIGSTLVSAVLFALGFRLATAPEVPTQSFLRGACVSAVIWQVLLAVGGYLIAHVLRNAEDLYGLFGIVLGLFTWLHLQARLTILVMEADCVRARRLWPRTLDGPRLVRADIRAFQQVAQAQQRRHSILISVAYQDPDTATVVKAENAVKRADAGWRARPPAHRPANPNTRTDQ
jgi:membrane protein